MRRRRLGLLGVAGVWAGLLSARAAGPQSRPMECVLQDTKKEHVLSRATVDVGSASSRDHETDFDRQTAMLIYPSDYYDREAYYRNHPGRRVVMGAVREHPATQMVWVTLYVRTGGRWQYFLSVQPSVNTLFLIRAGKLSQRGPRGGVQSGFEFRCLPLEAKP